MLCQNSSEVAYICLSCASFVVAQRGRGAGAQAVLAICVEDACVSTQGCWARRVAHGGRRCAGVQAVPCEGSCVLYGGAAAEGWRAWSCAGCAAAPVDALLHGCAGARRCEEARGFRQYTRWEQVYCVEQPAAWVLETERDGYQAGVCALRWGCSAGEEAAVAGGEQDHDVGVTGVSDMRDEDRTEES